MAETRIQLCGPLIVRIAGERVESGITGQQARLLLGVLVLERRRPLSRDALAEALWGGDPPLGADSALSALLSRLRRVVPVTGRGDVRLSLPADAWVDVEAAREAVHRAEGAISRADWAEAWGPARVAQHIASREFLPGEAGTWAAERRRELGDVLVRALELAATASLGIGGSELDTAERTARRLVSLAPLRESATRLLMQTHEQRGNRAEALLAYDELRVQLRETLGVAPSAETQALHRRLID